MPSPVPNPVPDTHKANCSYLCKIQYDNGNKKFKNIPNTMSKFKIQQGHAKYINNYNKSQATKNVMRRTDEGRPGLLGSAGKVEHLGWVPKGHGQNFNYKDKRGRMTNERMIRRKGMETKN